MDTKNASSQKVKDFLSKKYTIHDDVDRWTDERGYYYIFKFKYQYPGWYISAGCREWHTFQEAKTHYTDPDWRIGSYTPVRREKYKRRSLEILSKMSVFAKKHNIKLIGDPKTALKKKVKAKRPAKKRPVKRRKVKARKAARRKK